MKKVGIELLGQLKIVEDWRRCSPSCAALRARNRVRQSAWQEGIKDDLSKVVFDKDGK